MDRWTELLVTFDETTEIHGLRVIGSRIEYLGGDGQPLVPSFAAVGHGYVRDAGSFKSTTRVMVDPTAMTADVRDWVGQFDRVIAVDTNTVDLDGTKLCVSVSARAEIEFVGLMWNASFHLQDAFVFINPSPGQRPEAIGWTDALGRLNDEPDVHVGMVVDSELGAHPQMNLGRQAILDERVLPPNVRLIYAAGDRDTHLPFNALLAACDSGATSIIKIIRRDRARLDGLVQSNGGLLESSFHWPAKKRVPRGE